MLLLELLRKATVEEVNSYCYKIWGVFMEKLTFELVFEGWTIRWWGELEQRDTFLLRDQNK